MTDDAGPAETLEDQLARVETMAAVARLAGGAAHDLNNLLTTINGYSDLALAGLVGNAAYGDISEVRRAGDRTTALTRDLLVIGQRQIAPPVSIEADAVLAKGIDELRERAGGRPLETSFAALGGRMAIAPAALVRLVGNVVENAAEAIADIGKEGSIRVTTRRVTGPDDTWIDPGVLPGEWYRVLVADDGPGMDDDIRRHAFEPYFSTRPKIAGRTTNRGLGLAIVWGIARQAGGHVGLASSPDAGTFVRVYLPIAAS